MVRKKVKGHYRKVKGKRVYVRPYYKNFRGLPELTRKEAEFYKQKQEQTKEMSKEYGVPTKEIEWYRQKRGYVQDLHKEGLPRDLAFSDKQEEERYKKLSVRLPYMGTWGSHPVTGKVTSKEAAELLFQQTKKKK